MTKNLSPCRFCGETESFDVDAGAWPDIWAVDADGAVLRDERGEPSSIHDTRFKALHYLDMVTCKTCGAMATARVWNSTPGWLASMMANIAAADAEYDDEGVWRGQAVPA